MLFPHAETQSVARTEIMKMRVSQPHGQVTMATRSLYTRKVECVTAHVKTNR